jgi:hypothetical protein
MMGFCYPNKTKVALFPFMLILLIFFSCGIEDYPYLYPVPSGNITRELDYYVAIQIPDDNSSVSYFTHFTIFYRIYISDAVLPSLSQADTDLTILQRINSQLYNHYMQVRPYIRNDSMGSSSIASLFRSINYFPLVLEAQNIDTVLSRNVLGQTLIINFANGRSPYLAINGNEYVLRRNGSGSFQLIPSNGYFINSQDIRNPEYLSNNVNRDVTDNPNVSRNNTYVAMFIVATGLDSQTFAQLFSSPTFIGVLRLPD